MRKGLMADNITDKEIIKRVKNGDKKAYDLLVLKYQQRVINLISRFVKNHADALDVSQETFIKAYKALPNFRGESAFYTWLYRIAVNTAKNHFFSNKAVFKKNIDNKPLNLYFTVFKIFIKFYWAARHNYNAST